MNGDGHIREVRQRLVLSGLVVVADVVGLVLLALSGMLAVPTALALGIAAVFLVWLIWRR